MRRYIAFIFIVVLLAGCDRPEMPFTPDVLYKVSTSEGDGYATFSSGGKKAWKGVFYEDDGSLYAVAKSFKIKPGKQQLNMVIGKDQKMELLSYSLYEAPLFEECPETWEYTDSVYAVKEITDITYGKARGCWTTYPDTLDRSFLSIYLAKIFDKGEKELNLDMDMYLPLHDGTALRPLLVLVHGGAFYNGDKADPGFPQWGRFFAGLGYAVASVNYRLGFGLLLPPDRAGYRAVQDVNAAIRYIVHNRDKYQVDPNRVFVAGTSAGGITALNVAFMTDKNRPESAKKDGKLTAVNPQFTDKFSIRAVGNMWGAVNDLAIIDNAPGTSIVSFHSKGDPVVPFGQAHPFEKVFGNEIMFPEMYGSKMITERAGKNRAKLYEYDMPNRHTLHLDYDEETETRKLNDHFFEIEYGMRNFFSSVMLPHPFVPQHKDNAQTFTYDATDIDTITWKADGGVILSEEKGSVNVLFLSRREASLVASGTYKSGLTFYKKCY